jgi:integrase
MTKAGPRAKPLADATAARARLAARQADLAEIKARKLAGELVEAAEVEATWSGVLRTVRAGVLAIPSRVAHKTSARIWVPMPKRLIEHLKTRARKGDYIVMSPTSSGMPWRETSLTNELNRITRELGFTTTDSKGSPRFYSPHGLRHLCGVELAHAGASDRQIAAVLGHSTMKQVATYVAQAQQRLLARGAQTMRDKMYENEELETLIDLAGNVTKLRA